MSIIKQKYKNRKLKFEIFEKKTFGMWIWDFEISEKKTFGIAIWDFEIPYKKTFGIWFWDFWPKCGIFGPDFEKFPLIKAKKAQNFLPSRRWRSGFPFRPFSLKGARRFEESPTNI